MEWTDEGIVLAVRRHGETAVIVTLLTRVHGRHAGLVHGGVGKAKRGMLQPGNEVHASWRARLSEQLGSFQLDPGEAHASLLLDDRDRLAALASACALSEAALPEREPHPASFSALAALLHAFKSESWPSVYVHWEMALLRDLGYGLDLSTCAATGTSENLAYVSPKSARAVSAEAGEPYRDKLLPLPAFLLGGGEGDRAAVVQGLALTGFFLDRHIHAVPAARSRLVDRFRP